MGHSLRRLAHAADGDVHRAVRDLDRRHVEVQGPRRSGSTRRSAAASSTARCSRARTQGRTRRSRATATAAGPRRVAAWSTARTSSPRRSSPSCSTRRSSSRARRRRRPTSLTKVQQRIDARARAAGFGKTIHTELQSRGLVVTVVTDKVLFDSGSAALRSEGAPLLALVARALKAVPNPVLIDGYTDNVPIATVAVPVEPVPVRRPGRAGRASTSCRSGSTRRGCSRPASANATRSAPNDTAAGRARNRRVEIIVQSSVVQQTLDNVGLDKTPTTTPAAGDVEGAPRGDRRHQAAGLRHRPAPRSRLTGVAVGSARESEIR